MALFSLYTVKSNGLLNSLSMVFYVGKVFYLVVNHMDGILSETAAKPLCKTHMLSIKPSGHWHAPCMRGRCRPAGSIKNRVGRLVHLQRLPVPQDQGGGAVAGERRCWVQLGEGMSSRVRRYGQVTCSSVVSRKHSAWKRKQRELCCILHYY